MPASNNNNPKSLANLTNAERVKPEEVPVETILENKFKLVELVQNHPLLGLTYNAINQKGDGFILKMDADANLLSFVKTEGGFLQAVAKANAAEYFTEIVHAAKWKNYIYFATKFRQGPSLNDCWCSMPEGKFTVGTATRVFYSIVKAIEKVHQLGYLLRRIDPNVIKFDAATRQIYLSDLSSVRLNPTKLKMQVQVRWAGAPIYAPLQFHQGKSYVEKHDIEAAIYLLVEMTVGKLPWDGAPNDMVGSVKRQATTSQSLFAGCPPAYASIYTYITLLSDSDKVEYSQIYSKLEEAWKSAGVKDFSSQLDFEPHMKKLEDQPQ